MDGAPSSIIGKLRSLLPLLLVCMIMLGLIMFAVTNIVPHWKTYQSLQSQTDEGNKAIQTAVAMAADTSDAAILKHRIETTQAELAKNSGIFMSAAQADAILRKLYGYAKYTTVEITNLQTQNSLDTNTGTSTQATPTSKVKQPAGSTAAQAAAPTVPSVPAYSVRAMRINVSGSVKDLINFLTQIREISVAGIAVNNLNIKDTDTKASLMMDLLVYTSPLSDGKAYENLPQLVLPPGVSVVIEPTATPTPSPQTAVTVVPTDAPTPISTGSISIITKDSTLPEPALSSVYTDNFETGNLDHWKLGAGWILFSTQGANSLQTTETSGETIFAHDNLNNAAIEMRVMMSSSSIKLTLRESSAGFYGVVLAPTGQVALYRGNVLVKTTTTDQSSIGRWRVLRLSAVKGIVRISIDGVEVLTARDEAELPPGTFGFSAIGRGIIRVDDVQVWSLDTNTPY